MTIRENTIATEATVFGPRIVKVLTVNEVMNTALIQFKKLEKPPTPQNTYPTILDKLS